MRDAAELTAAWDTRVLHLTSKLTASLASVVNWLREPKHLLVRVIAAALFILGGVFSILPVLGVWMLPLGLGLLAEDVPGMKPPLEKASVWLIEKWQELLAKWRKLRHR